MFTKTVEYIKDIVVPPKELSESKKGQILISSIEDHKERREATDIAVKMARPDKYYKTVYDWHVDSDRLNSLLKKAVSNLPNNKNIPPNTKNILVADYTDYGMMDNRTPAATSFYDVFYNPFEIYSYLYKNHPVVFSAVTIIREEMANDGYILKHMKGTPKKRLRSVYDLLKKQRIEKLRLDIATHLKLYGNAFLVQTKDRYNKDLGQFKRETLELLNPQKIKPVIDYSTGEITAWKYRRGKTWEDYPLDKMFHLWLFNADAEKQLGDPPLQSALLDCEIDLGIKTYTRQILEKGFLGSVVFGVDPPGDPDSWDYDVKRYVKDVSDTLTSQLTGANAGGSPLVVAGLKTQNNISPIGSQDGPFPELSKSNARIICMCLGVPSEKLGFNRSENLQYVAQFTEYTVNASFDKSIYCLVGTVDDFINDAYFKKIHGIDDVIIQAGGRFGSLTVTAAQVIQILATAGPIITVNDALEIILGWEPLPPENPRGRWVLDNTKGRMEGGKTNEVPRYPGLVNPEQEDLELTSSNRQLKSVSWDSFWTTVGEIADSHSEKKTVWDDDKPATSMHVRAGKAPRFYYEGPVAV